MKPLVDEKTAREVADEAKQIVAEAIKDAEQATGMTHEEFRESYSRSMFNRFAIQRGEDWEGK